MKYFKSEVPQYPTVSPIDYIRSNTTYKKQSISVLSQYEPFYRVWTSDLGRQLMEYFVNRHADALKKITSFDATDHDKIRYEEVTVIIRDIANIIDTYEKELHNLETSTSSPDYVSGQGR